MAPKISTILTNWPQGTAGSTRWFEKMGIERSLLTSYKRTGWIRSLGQGAYARFDDPELDWMGAVYALQNHYEYDMHPASRTALSLHGYSYYSRWEGDRVLLFTQDKNKNILPLWARRVGREDYPLCLIQANLFRHGVSALQDYTPENRRFSIKISTPEQALLETLLHAKSKHIDLEEAYNIFECVQALDVSRMMYLLENCISVKVKRLFMVMATRLEMPWLKKLDLGGVDFGSGTRTIVRGGRLDKEYRITVPEEWYDPIFPEV